MNLMQTTDTVMPGTAADPAVLTNTPSADVARGQRQEQDDNNDEETYDDDDDSDDDDDDDEDEEYSSQEDSESNEGAAKGKGG